MLERTLTLGLFLLMVFPLAAARGQENTPPPVVAVFLIENRGSPLTEDELVALTDYLGTKLGERGRYQIIPREEIRRRLLEQKKESFKECYDQSCQIDIGRELAAQLTVSSSISRVGSACIITAAMYDLRKAATARTATAKGPCTADDLLVAVEQIATKLEGPSGAPAGLPGAQLLPPQAPVQAPPQMPPRKLRTKSTVLACFLAFLPGGGMFYLEKWGWGLFYSLTYLTGMGLFIGGILQDEIALGISSIAVASGIYVVGFIHTLVAAESWEDPNAERISPGNRFGQLPASNPGRDPHPAIVIPVFTGRF